jgi:hypothetical protein
MPSSILHRQALLPIRSILSSARCVLVPTEVAADILGEENEVVNDLAFDGSKPDHLRFVFDIGLSDKRSELRFWKTEIVELRLSGTANNGSGTATPLAPATCRRFTIRNAIAEILGAREYISRGELGIQWRISSNHLTNLIRDGDLKSPNGARLPRPDLENFLLKRWIGTPRVNVINLGHPVK